MKKFKKIFFVGIKGVGMAPLAILAKEAGFEVSGSDVAEEFITDAALLQAGIKLCVGFGNEDLEEFVGSNKEKVLVITTGAHGGFDNPQVVWAKQNGIQVFSYGEALGKFMGGEILGRRDLQGISIAASHGKTTISALLATLLNKLNADPSYIIGTGEVFPLGAPGHYGEGKFFIVEADEYKAEPNYDPTPKFLYQKPYAAIFNNIDFDHPDQFKNIEEVENAFAEFAKNIHPQGVLVINGDDSRLSKFKEMFGKTLNTVSFGSAPTNDFSLSHFYQSGLNSFFKVSARGMDLGEFSLSIPGVHNAKNAVGAIALLSELGFSIQEIKKALPIFSGTKRRFEVVGETPSGVTIIDDYGHHPQEIRATLAAVHEAYPDKKIVCVFQGHTYSRTRALLSEFAVSFSNAASLILLPTFSSAREAAPTDSQEQEIVAAFRQFHLHVEFFKSEQHVIEYITTNFNRAGYVIVTMGAGNVYKVGEGLLTK